MSPDELFKIAEFLKQNSHHVEGLNLDGGTINFAWCGGFPALEKLNCNMYHKPFTEDGIKKYDVTIM
jgi:hypothetical protein